MSKDELAVTRVINQNKKLVTGLSNLRCDKVLTDVTIVVEGKKLEPCHRVVLAASCEYFCAMFSHQMAEEKKDEVELKGFTYKAISTIVDFIYTGVSGIEVETVQEILVASSILQVKGLYEEAKDFMIGCLSRDNCLEAYQFACTISCNDLKKSSFSMICKYAKRILFSEEFLEVSKETVVDIISSDYLMIDNEEIIYETVLSWIAHNIVERTKYTSELFSHIRMAILDGFFLQKCLIDEPSLREFSGIKQQASAAKRYNNLCEKYHRSLMTPDDENIYQTEEDKANNDFCSFPYYYVEIGEENTKIRIPLNSHLRAGMRSRDLLLFTTGNLTRLYDPNTRLSYGSEPTNKGNEDDSDSLPDENGMQTLKNCDCFSTFNGSVYLLGGLELVSQETSVEPKILCKFWKLDTKELKWRQKKSLPNPRCMAAIGEMNGSVYVMGGKSVEDNSCVSRVDIYCPETNSWTNGPDMIRAVYGHSCASLRKNKIFVIGGKSQNKEILSDVYCLNGDSNNWHIMSSLTTPRFLTSVAVSPNYNDNNEETIYVLGGIGRIGLHSSFEVLKGTRLSSKWKNLKNFPERRCAQTLCFIEDNLYAYGGHITARMQTGRYESCARHDFYKFNPHGGDEGEGKWSCEINKVDGLTSLYAACTKVELDLCKIDDDDY